MIYTLGTSDRSKEEFLRVLEEYKITCVFDIRSKTGSRVLHFDETRFKNLSKMLNEKGITYCLDYHTSLGGMQNGIMTIGNFRKYAMTAEFKEALKLLEDTIENMKEGNALLICCERNWKQCHRMIVAEKLRGCGLEVDHIE